MIVIKDILKIKLKNLKLYNQRKPYLIQEYKNQDNTPSYLTKQIPQIS